MTIITYFTAHGRPGALKTPIPSQGKGLTIRTHVTSTSSSARVSGRAASVGFGNLPNPHPYQQVTTGMWGLWGLWGWFGTLSPEQWAESSEKVPTHKLKWKPTKPP